MKSENVRELVSKNLIKLREEKGASFEEIAGAVGRSVRTVKSWESGKALPDLVTAYRIAAFYDIEVARLFE